eukprot:3987085-Amphidinium_carterae.1
MSPQTQHHQQDMSALGHVAIKLAVCAALLNSVIGGTRVRGKRTRKATNSSKPSHTLHIVAPCKSYPRSICLVNVWLGTANGIVQ